MFEFDNLLVDQQDGVLRIAFNRPKANAFDGDMISEFQSILKQAGRDESVRALLLTGNGRFFSAGQDVSAFGEGEQVSFRDHLRRTFNLVVARMRRLEKPIVGAINGPAAGAALGIALATDVRIAAESAQFILAFTGIGLTCDSGTSLTLPLAIGMSRATWMAFTNDPLTASQALDYGLVNRVVPDEELEKSAFELALRLANGPTRAIGLTKRAFNRTMLPDLESVLEFEAQLQEIAGKTADHASAVQAFLKKEKAVYQGK